MSNTATLTLRLSPETRDRLEKLADATHRSKSFLAAEAIEAFLEVNEWQVREIQAAVAEADRGEFATDQEVENFRTKWGLNAG